MKRILRTKTLIVTFLFVTVLLVYWVDTNKSSTEGQTIILGDNVRNSKKEKASIDSYSSVPNHGISDTETRSIRDLQQDALNESEICATQWEKVKKEADLLAAYGQNDRSSGHLFANLKIAIQESRCETRKIQSYQKVKLKRVHFLLKEGKLMEARKLYMNFEDSVYYDFQFEAMKKLFKAAKQLELNIEEKKDLSEIVVRIASETIGHPVDMSPVISVGNYLKDLSDIMGNDSLRSRIDGEMERLMKYWEGRNNSMNHWLTTYVSKKGRGINELNSEETKKFLLQLDKTEHFRKRISALLAEI